MVLDGVKEKYDSMKEIGFCNNSSSFILCDCIKNDKGNYLLNDIIPLENKLCNIKLDRKNVLLTDQEGKILMTFEDWQIDNTAIEYVNNNDLIISNYITYRPNYVLKKQYHLLDHYHYDKELNKVNTLYDIKNGVLHNFEIVDEDTIKIEINKEFQKHSRLYSISKKDYLTPDFRELEIVEKTNNKIFKYIDKIYSTLDINGIKYSSKIIGFVTIDGKFFNGVYDELSNKEIECELNTKPNFEEYEELKKMIQGKLNEKVIKQSNKETTKEFTIKKLENKAKNMIK